MSEPERPTSDDDSPADAEEEKARLLARLDEILRTSEANGMRAAIQEDMWATDQRDPDSSLGLDHFLLSLLDSSLPGREYPPWYKPGSDPEFEDSWRRLQESRLRELRMREQERRPLWRHLLADVPLLLVYALMWGIAAFALVVYPGWRRILEVIELFLGWFLELWR